ncbi:MAG TPA: hypothetical protein VF322_02155 [Gammaproteobacteria bacterium]
MGPLLRRVRGAAFVAACLAAAGPAAGQVERGDRHRLTVTLDATYVAPASDLAAWPGGGLGKLRYDEGDQGAQAARVLAEYRGRLTRTLAAHVTVDYHDGASGGLGVTEAFVVHRPLPKSANEHQWRFGAFYPPFSLENGDAGWSSPFTQSFSAVNTWLGEEVRPIGAEWSLRRRLGLGSPHELRAFAAAFMGNDPAGTLLFWRGWSLHDRQTRLDDRLAAPPKPIWVDGVIVGSRPQHVEPFEEIDDEPGAYAGLEWRYARRVLVQAARYDNRSDPHAFAHGQWGWHTAFDHLAVQAELPGGVGLLAQWLRGETYWIEGARSNGTLSPSAELVKDRFEASFVMVTKRLGGAHRASLRYDDFGVRRSEAAPALVSDDGRAWTVAYRYERVPRWSVGVEWLAIESRRDLWPEFYGAPPEARERQLRVGVAVRLGSRAQ